MTRKFADAPFNELKWNHQIDDLYAIKAREGDDIGCYVEAYFVSAIDSTGMEPDTKTALKKAACALADAIESICPAAVIPLRPPATALMAMAYGPDIPLGQVLFAVSIPEGKTCLGFIPIEEMPDDDWPLIDEAKKLGYVNLPGSLWTTLFDVIEQNEDNKFEATVNAICLRTALSGQGALGILKDSCRTIVKNGHVPLLGATCHRKFLDAVAAVSMTLILPPPISVQIAMAEGGNTKY